MFLHQRQHNQRRGKGVTPDSSQLHCMVKNTWQRSVVTVKSIFSLYFPQEERSFDLRYAANMENYDEIMKRRQNDLQTELILSLMEKLRNTR